MGLSILPKGYEIREMSGGDFAPLWEKHAKTLFDDTQLIFRPLEHFSDQEKEKISSLRENVKNAIRIRLGLFLENEFVGWSWGFQESAETFYMCNSGVLEVHRRKGLYTALMNKIVEMAIALGFQKIYSRHTATNNAIIIPKLKAGFVITNFELSDNFGVLVHLCYYPNPLRRKILDFRAGQSKPNDEVKKVFKL